MRIKLVKGWRGRRTVAVELPVTRRDLADGIDALRPGRYLFHGAWYGRDLAILRTYGKIAGQKGMPIGKLSGRPTPYLLRRLGARTTRIWVDPARRDRPLPPGFAPLADLAADMRRETGDETA